MWIYLTFVLKRADLVQWLQFIVWPEGFDLIRRAYEALDVFKRRSFMARVQKSTDSSSLAEVVDRILDKGIVIDAWVKVSLVGIELITIEARIVVASVETYLKYAEAVGLTASAAAPA
jgi:hypothetical protein